MKWNLNDHQQSKSDLTKPARSMVWHQGAILLRKILGASTIIIREGSSEQLLLRKFKIVADSKGINFSIKKLLKC